MATNYSHPGVFIEEVPAAPTIQGAPTSVAAFVGPTEEGPYGEATHITSWAAYQRTFGGLTWRAYLPWAVFEFFNEGGGQCYVVRAQDPAGTGTAASTQTIAPLIISAASAGSWGKTLQIVISNASPSAKATDTQPLFALSVVVKKTDVFPASQNDQSPPLTFDQQLLQRYIRINDLSPQIIGGNSGGGGGGGGNDDANTFYTLESFSGFTKASFTPSAAGQPSPIEQRINATSMFIRVSPQPGADLTMAPRPPNTPTPTPLLNGTDPVFDFKTPTRKLAKVQGISLLAIPDIVTITNNGILDNTAFFKQSGHINDALAFCESERNLLYVIDPPFGLDVQTIAYLKTGQLQDGNGDSIAALSSIYGALYCPWVDIMNPLTGDVIPVPPSGAVLGRYAFTDNNVGVFKSPAGVRDGALRTVIAVETTISDSDQDLLNPDGINAIRNLINYGNVIYGARTLAPAGTDWTYVAIRRFFIFVEQSLRNSLQWVVFEPNDQRLWAAVTRDIGAFLTTLWHQGALFGATPAEAFFVVCDESNNPPESRAEGTLYIDVGLAPVYPAEFVVIRITQKTASPTGS